MYVPSHNYYDGWNVANVELFSKQDKSLPAFSSLIIGVYD